MKVKICTCCKKEKSTNNFHKNKNNKDGLTCWCKNCRKIYSIKTREKSAKYLLEWRHNKKISNSMYENKTCSNYLGIVISEGVLNKVFKNVERMPNNNPGFDFICNKGYKIDVKSAVLKKQKEKRNKIWKFSIKKNIVPDYFLLLGFNNREDLKPLKLWLIPSQLINQKNGIGITNIKTSLQKWEQFELKDKLEQVITCCNALKGVT